MRLVTCNGFKQASLPRVCLQRAALVATVCWEVARQLPAAARTTRADVRLLLLLILLVLL